VWPRDIDTAHLEQKEELDALAATLEQEARAKEENAGVNKRNKMKASKAKEQRRGSRQRQTAADHNEMEQSGPTDPSLTQSR